MIAVLAPEPIRPRMAGMGIRALELARALSARVRARGCSFPTIRREARGRRRRPRRRRRVAGPARRGRARRAAPRSCRATPRTPGSTRCRTSRSPSDLYDPFPIENLHYARTLGEETARHDRETLAARARARRLLPLRLARAAPLLRRRALRERADRRGELSRTIRRSRGCSRSFPFGVPESPASGDRAAGRRAASASRRRGRSFSSAASTTGTTRQLLLEAWPRVLRARARGAAALLREPEPRDHAAARLRGGARSARRRRPRRRARSISRPGFPTPRAPTSTRRRDLAVSISSEGLETELAYRTRLLDAAWGGVPSRGRRRRLARAGARRSRRGRRVRARPRSARRPRSRRSLGTRPAGEQGRAAARVRRGADVGERRGAASRLVPRPRVDPGPAALPR